jgi:hypothetical protein
LNLRRASTQKSKLGNTWPSAEESGIGSPISIPCSWNNTWNVEDNLTLCWRIRNWVSPKQWNYYLLLILKQLHFNLRIWSHNSIVNTNINILFIYLFIFILYTLPIITKLLSIRPTVFLFFLSPQTTQWKNFVPVAACFPSGNVCHLVSWWNWSIGQINPEVTPSPGTNSSCNDNFSVCIVWISPYWQISYGDISGENRKVFFFSKRSNFFGQFG